MNNRITRNRCVIVLAVVAVAAASIQMASAWLQPTVAQSQLQDGSVRFVSSSIFGIPPGQKLRISLGTRPGSPGPTNIEFTVSVLDTQSQVAFESERIRVPSGEWRFLDVSRGDLNIEGEPGTGRAQGMALVFIEAPRGAKSSDFIGSREVVDEGTGETVDYLTITLQLPT